MNALVRGLQYLQNNDFMKAVCCFTEEKIKGDKETAEKAHLELARTFFKANRYKDAYELFEDLTNDATTEKNRYFALVMMATILTIQGESNESYTKALELMNQVPESKYIIQRTYVLYYAFKYNRMVGAFEKAKRLLCLLESSNPTTWMQCRIKQAFGMFYRANKDYDRAISCFEEALHKVENNTSKVKYLNDIIETYLEQGELSKAESYICEIQKYLKTLDDETELATYLKLHGSLLKKGKKEDEAEGFLLEAAKIFKEYGLMRELAEVELILARRIFDAEGVKFSCALDRGLEKYSKYLHLETEAEEVRIKDEKTIRYIVDCHVDGNDTSSGGFR